MKKRYQRSLIRASEVSFFIKIYKRFVKGGGIVVYTNGIL